MKKLIKFNLTFIFLSTIFYSCGIVSPDAHSGMHIYDDPKKMGKVGIYFYDMEKNIFIKIAEGANARFIPKTEKVVYSDGTNPMYGNTLGIHTVNTDGSGDRILATATTNFFISSQVPYISPMGDKILS